MPPLFERRPPVATVLLKHFKRSRFCASNCRFRGSLRSSAESAKKGVDGENGGQYKPPLPKRAACPAEAKFRAHAQLFDIAGIRKRNAGGMNCLRSLRLHDDHDECVSRKYLFIMCPVSAGQFVMRVSRQNAKLQSAILRPVFPGWISSEIGHST